MNEIQIIQKQLATERAHFNEVTRICADRLDASGSYADNRGADVADAGGRGADGRDADVADAGSHGVNGDFAAACADYFAFAVRRFDAPTAQRLAARLAGGPRTEFLQAFTEASRQHFERLDALLPRNLPVTEWRAVSRIDADSIFAERTLYSRMKAAIPP
jgi:hypothetical protein